MCILMHDTYKHTYSHYHCVIQKERSLYEVNWCGVSVMGGDLSNAYTISKSMELVLLQLDQLTAPASGGGGSKQQEC